MEEFPLITAEHVRDLAESRAEDPALVIYTDGRYEVRSTVPRVRPHEESFVVVIRQRELDDIDQSGTIDFDNLTDEECALIAAHLNTVEGM